MSKKAVVVAGSRGIGKAIADCLSDLNFDVLATSKKDLDTSNLKTVKEFINKNQETDVLVLNTGGPPAINFYNITEDEFQKYHNQLFLSFCLMLQNIEIRDGGYVFLISSFNIKEPNPKLLLSNCYRIAFTSVLKSLSRELSKRNVTCINIAPGPIKTERLYNLVENMEEFEKQLPLQRAAEPSELGLFVKTIVENNIKYLNGVTINFDGGHSNYVL
ncbi:MAG: putative enoyl-(acyl carrier protein) reductase [Prokaryotic dsDNA virus sp.]|nr:MAG: putative enoyl-(acyl carrier protein) reductase [Prokaryotic dsDNA virus sp.]|tara:strand:- start:3313 stop:3963 length:651 start_codon:yes stop_codon:yes gene_type:complete